MANNEHIEQLEKGVKAWNQWRLENPSIIPDLKNADLRAKELSGCNLSKAKLDGAQMMRTVLKAANLSKASLRRVKGKWADLTGADIREVDAFRANLSESRMSNAKMNNSNFEEANLNSTNLMSSKGNRVSFCRAKLQGTIFNNSDFNGADFESSDLKNAQFLNSTLDSSSFLGVTGNNALFREAEMSNVIVDNADFTGANFNSAILRNVDFRRAIVKDSSFNQAITDEKGFLLSELSDRQKEELGVSVDISEDERVNVKDESVDTDHLFDRAKKYFNDQDYDRSIELYDQILEKKSEPIRACYRKGLALKKKAEHVKAKECFKRGAVIDSGKYSEILHKGYCFVELKRHDDALKCFDKCLSIRPEDSVVLVEKGLLFSRKGDNQSALKYYEDAIAIDGNYAYAYYVRGLAFYKLNDFISAIGNYRKVLEFEPDNSNALRELGMSYLKIGDQKLAKESFEKAISINPKDDYALQILHEAGNNVSLLTTTKYTAKIYITYSFADSEFCDSLVKVLRDAGHKVNYFEGLQPEVDYISKLDEFLSNSDVYIPLISKKSVGNPNVKSDIDKALDSFLRRNPVFVMPLLLDNVEEPTYLSNFSCMRMSRDWNEDSKEHLIEVFERSIKSVFKTEIEISNPESESKESEFEGDVGSFGNDCHIQREASLKERCLDVHLYANVLSTFFKKASDCGEFCFGLFGHWGRGKTYLIKRVEEELSKDKEHYYETIHFSAWKYRTTPEAWIHLYETFSEHLTKSKNWLNLLPYLIRNGLAHLGIIPVLFSLILFGFSLFPLMKFVTGVSFYIVSILGVSAVLFLIRISLGFRRIAPILNQYVKLKRHGDKLGLQAMIGKDLKSLIIGWVPLDFFKGTFWKWGFSYLVTVSLVSFLIFPVKPQSWPSWLLCTSGNPVWLIWTIFSLWFIMTLAVMLFVVEGGRGTKQLLLVIDDLDRCKPEQMLEIMESIKLMLEDEDTHKRIQVTMLVDEEMLHYAIQKKFEFFKKENHGNGGLGNGERIVNEHVEKMFACYLRLPELSFNEVEEVSCKYIELHGSIDVIGEGGSATDTADFPESDGDSTESSFEVTKDLDGFHDPVRGQEMVEAVGTEGNRGISIEDTVFSQYERERLALTIPSISKADKSRKWGPRSVRAFLFKYQLSRLLLMSLRPNFMPKQLLDEFNLSMSGAMDSGKIPVARSKIIKKVVNQVK